MSYVFGATLALAGITTQQEQEYGPGHRTCSVCRIVTGKRLNSWLKFALAIQHEEARTLWCTSMSFAHARGVFRRLKELNCS